MAKKTKAEDPTMAQEDKQTSNAGASQASAGPSVTEGLADSAKQAGSQAKEAASRAFSQAKEQVTSRADEQRQTLASGIGAVAQAFNSMSEDLKKKEQGPIAEYTAEFGQAIGGQVEKLATYLNGRDVKQLIGDTEEFARRNPGAFLGTAFVLGIAASRFFKSSSTSASGGSQPSYPNPATQPAHLALPPASQPSTATSQTPAYDISSGTTSTTAASPTTTGTASSGQTVKPGNTTVGSNMPSTSGL